MVSHKKAQREDPVIPPFVLDLCLFLSAFIRGWSLLLCCFLSPGLVSAVTAPDSVERAVRLDLVGNEATARAADSHGHVAALLNAHAIGVVAPNEPVGVAGR